MRILLVEDYEPLRNAVAQGLREAGFAVDVTGDGEEGLWYGLSNDYDAIVLDIMLPGVDGLTILRRLRQKKQTVPILLLTARDRVEDRVCGLDGGADDYLVNPFAFDELLARIRALVRRGYGRKNPIISIGDLKIDTAKRTVSRRGISLSLTAREYALLEYLALRAGEVVSRTDIWEHVYDFHSMAESNVVDVYIGYLRKKIERPEWPRLIHTHRGQGYMLGC